ncbi:MAG: hypothetical protein L6R38_004947 [Xanthoria sp. 2 TBL-2021]|nr:MAG: hypothetical protein L6R38_004947 [Xanthoria sp. 2 TBL-2021]
MVIHLGIIGLSADPQAWATMAHVPPIKGPLASHYKITAVATSTPGTAKASAKAHGLPEEKGYSNPNDIANDVDVDIVVVSVKPPLHKQPTIPALKAKKHVLVDGLKEAQEMAELGQEFRGVAGEDVAGFRQSKSRAPSHAFVRRLDVSIDVVRFQAREIVQSDVLGRITSTTVLGSDSQLMNFPEKVRYINDPASGVSIYSIPVLSHRPNGHHPPKHPLHLPYRLPLLPEQKRHADNITVSGPLTPGHAVLNFHYLITAPATLSMFQCIISRERGALKMEGKSFAVQAKPPKLYFATPPEDEGAKGMNGNKGRGAEWKEVETPESKLGGVGGVAEIYRRIAEGRGVGDVSVLLFFSFFLSRRGASALHRNSLLTSYRLI